MSTSWSDTAIRTLRDGTACPRCRAVLVREGECDVCRADLSSTAALELWDEADELAGSIARWRSLADALPTLSAAAPAPLPVGATASAVAPTSAVSARPTAAPAAPPTTAASGPQISQQTVLAIAGAGLVAVAALVFTFLNPELTDFGTRTSIIGTVTAVFLAAAWLLARRGLRVSAETIGSLGLVFVLLDVWAFSSAAWAPPLVLAASALLVASVVLAVLARVSGVLVWALGAALAVLAVPALFGYATGDRWGILLGHLGVIAVAIGSLWLLPRVGARLAAAVPTLRVALTVAQGAAFCAAAGRAFELFAATDGVEPFGGPLVLLALAAFSVVTARVAYPAAWSFVAGVAATAAVALVPLALDPATTWLLASLPAAAALAVVVLECVRGRAWPRAMVPGLVRSGGYLALLVAVFPLGAVVLVRLISIGVPVIGRDTETAAILGLVSVAVGGALVALLSSGASRARAVAVSLWFAAAAVLMVAAWSAIVLPGQIAIGLGATAAIALASRGGVVATAPIAVRAPVWAIAHALVVVAATLSWSNRFSGVIAGAAVVSAVAVVGRFVPAAPRAVYVGAAYAYGLVVVATALDLSGLPLVAIVALTSTAASGVAFVATLVRRVPTSSWYVVLGVTAVPFLVGVGAVLAERSGWTAIATGAGFGLSWVLVRSLRPGMTRPLRTAASALLVPSLAVTVVCACAQLFVSSGSPIALPVIAAIVAAVLPAADSFGRALERRGIAAADARWARVAIESGALVTGAIATLLALVRIAAGLETTLLVLALIGVGGAASAVFAGRRYGWVIAAAAWTGALWSAYGLAGVGVLEAYLLPPAVAAAAVGGAAVVLGRGRERAGRRLFVAGLVGVAGPTSVALAFEGGAARTVGLLVGGCAAVLLAAVVARRPESWRLRRFAPLTGPTLLVAMGAAASGVLQAVRWGTGLDPDPLVAELAMLAVLGCGLAATLLAAGAGYWLSRATGSRSRWLFVPAVAYIAAAPIAGVEHSWLAIWTLWGVMAALLVGMLVTARLSLAGRVALPPVWLWFVLAWVVAVVGWSERELRVEAFSLPLGIALLAAGVVALPGVAHRAPVSVARLADWPAGFSGSWHLLAPGLVVTLAPSVLSTGTDPLTARAVLVIGLALIAILVGSKLRLAAPFVLGIVVLPIENVVVFSVQIGRSIGAAPWWITLATAGAVLLVLAVTSEKRDSAGHGVAARLRDLR